MRFLRSLLYLYLIIGIGFGLARFGWGALVAAMAEPEEAPFFAGVLEAAVSGAIRVVMWGPSLITDVVMGGGDFFNWLLYSV